MPHILTASPVWRTLGGTLSSRAVGAYMWYRQLCANPLALPRILHLGRRLCLSHRGDCLAHEAPGLPRTHLHGQFHQV